MLFGCTRLFALYYWNSNEIKIDINVILCPFKVNSITIELTVHTSCYCILDLLCVNSKHVETFYRNLVATNFSCKTFSAEIQRGHLAPLTLLQSSMLKSTCYFNFLCCLYLQNCKYALSKYFKGQKYFLGALFITL